MANGDGVFSYQDVFHYKPYDPLAFVDTESLCDLLDLSCLPHIQLAVLQGPQQSRHP